MVGKRFSRVAELSTVFGLNRGADSTVVVDGGGRPVAAMTVGEDNAKMGFPVKTTQTDPKALAAEVLRVSRRGLMCGALGMGAAAVLTACGGAGDGDTGAPTESTDGGPSTDTDTDTDKPIAVVSQIPVGGGMAVAGLVLVQPEEGRIIGFDGACPHQQTILPAPEDGVITCPSHQSQFSAEDGSLVQGPATTGLTEVPLNIVDGEVFRA